MQAKSRSLLSLLQGRTLWWTTNFRKIGALIMLTLGCEVMTWPQDSGQSVGAAAITVVSPKDYQVFQRQTRIRGRILIMGHCSVNDARLQYSLTGRSLGGDLPVQWTEVVSDRQTRAFKVEAPLAAGGWYRLGLRLLRGEETLASESIEHVGVGEVFVIAGQSNSTNYGEKRQRPNSGAVSTFGGQTWRPADDPQPGAQDRSNGGSFLPAFGDELAMKYRVPIGVVSTGCGATSIRQWLMKGEKIERLPTLTSNVITNAAGGWEATGDLFEGMMRRVEELGPQGFRAILWHQGESDAGQARSGYPANRQISGADYRKLLEKVIGATRERAGWKVPWFVALATYHSPADPGDAEFRAAQKSLWESGVALEGPDTDALTGDNRDHGGRGVHFSGAGLQAHGKLWAEKVGNYLDRILGTE